MFETIQHLDLSKDAVRKALLTLLSANGLTLDPMVEVTLGVWEEGRLIGTVSVYGQTIRSVAVATDYQGSNLIARLVDEAVGRIYAKGYDNVFVLTSQYGAKSFERLGFFVIMKTTTGFVLLERKPRGVAEYCQYLSDFKVCIENVGAIVMNANPFTLGHQYLVESAAERCDFLYIWVVKEEASAFPYETRLQLIRKGTAHLKNVYVLEGSDYVISRATFPSYFSVSSEDVITLHAELDLRIFGHYLAKQLGVKKRFVGTEPYCPTTSAYNRQMKRLLPSYGIEVVEIERQAVDGEAISASHVRACILEGNIQKLASLVPSSTYTYLISPEAMEMVKARLKKGQRH
jgi:[citrate (pro-3S)-lyase] ligase